jgi:type III secretory pathway lipoprotein EscJ
MKLNTRLSALPFFLSLLLFFLLVGCASDQIISQDEMRLQDAAANTVAAVLFEKDMDNLASYNVRRDGYVVIKFDAAVTFAQYNDIVEVLRSKKSIIGVHAEQGGKQVCARP